MWSALKQSGTNALFFQWNALNTSEREVVQDVEQQQGGQFLAVRRRLQQAHALNTHNGFPLLNLLSNYSCNQRRGSLSTLCIVCFMGVTSPSWLLRSSRVMTLDEISYRLGHSAAVKSWFAALTVRLLIYQSINPSISPLFTFIWNPCLSVKYTCFTNVFFDVMPLNCMWVMYAIVLFYQSNQSYQMSTECLWMCDFSSKGSDTRHHRWGMTAPNAMETIHQWWRWSWGHYYCSYCPRNVHACACVCVRVGRTVSQAYLAVFLHQ